MVHDKMIAAIEAVLFAAGEPVSVQELSKSLRLGQSQIRELLNEMEKLYRCQSRGIQLIRVNSKYQLCTKEEYHTYIDAIMVDKGNTKLTQPALETLAIIAYKQPVTRVEIESLRGVKSSSSVQVLLDRNLIKEAGRLDAPGKPILYATTSEFLKYAGIRTINELPKYEDFVQSVDEKENDKEFGKIEQINLYEVAVHTD